MKRLLLKRKKRILFLLPLALMVFGAFARGTPSKAETPYTTWTLGPGGTFYMTQDAYTPVEEIELPVAGPEEMFFAPDGFLYIADTGNQRVIRLDENFQVAAELGKGILQSPTGLFVDEAGTLYVADAGKNMVVILDRDGNLVKEFGRPTEPLFGNNRQFLPRKITVDSRKNLYVVSEGSVNGLVMLNTDGNFIGYFGANAAQMSLEMILRRTFLTQEQLDQFVKNEAASPSNVAIDARSLIYTITSGTTRDKSIRKFNISGKNLLDRVVGSTTFRDVHVSKNGLLLAVDGQGNLFEYATNGILLFTFGGQDNGQQRLGLLSNPSAVERVGDMFYVLDKDKNALITYRATDFATTVHKGVQLYVDGFYAEAKPYFEEVLSYNGLFIMAYQAIADAYYKEGNYPNALQTYRYAEDRDGYSEAFWELRNAVLQRSLANALLVMFGAWIVFGAFGRFERRYRWLDPLRHGLQMGRQRFGLLDDFAFMFRFIRKPVDSFYYIKYDLRGSLLFAFLIYAWVVISHVLSLYVTSFIFNTYSAGWQIHLELEIVYLVALIFLWNVANYLVAAITDGEGRLRHVIIGSAYSLFPYALFALPLAVISNVLTMNEVFIYNFSWQIILAWSAFMLAIMVKEIHNFSVSETVRNLLTTFFTMAIFMLSGYILYVLFSQLYEFVMAIIQEVGLRG
jgi:tetratricopeptide (TPR) repeat protein